MDGKKYDIVTLEKAIKERYGEEATVNPKKDLTPEMIKEYLEQSKQLFEKSLEQENKNEKEERNGYLVTKKILRSVEKNKSCPVCNVYSIDVKDDLYFNRFECCYQCYVKYVEDREERWKTGWRPSAEEGK
jgi:hypothetical protein